MKETKQYQEVPHKADSPFISIRQRPNPTALQQALIYMAGSHTNEEKRKDYVSFRTSNSVTPSVVIPESLPNKSKPNKGFAGRPMATTSTNFGFSKTTGHSKSPNQRARKGQSMGEAKPRGGHLVSDIIKSFKANAPNSVDYERIARQLNSQCKIGIDYQTDPNNPVFKLALNESHPSGDRSINELVQQFFSGAGRFRTVPRG